MSVTADTSHDPMGPCEPVVQLPRGASLRHVSTARLSSVVFCDENAGVEAGGRGRCVVVAMAVVVDGNVVTVMAVVVDDVVIVEHIDPIDPDDP